jgi:Ca-activated chloride channel family protein
MRPSRATVVLALLVPLCASLAALGADPESAASDREPASFAVGLQVEPGDPARPAPSAPRLLRAVQEIDVYGGMAVGTLIQEFENPAESEQSAAYGCSIRGAVEPRQLELEIAGPGRELALQPADPDDKRTKKDRRGHQFFSEPFTIPGEEQATLRTGFQLALPLEGRTFKLTAPRVHRGSVETTEHQGAAGAVPADAVPVKIVVTVHHGEPLMEVRSPSHEILVDFVGDRTIIETVRPEVPGDRAFELEFAVNSKESPTVAGYLRSDEEGRSGVEALLTPPEEPVEQSIRPKQMIFVIDTSGSMGRQEKMLQARRAVASCVEKMGADDRFNIIEFDTDFTLLSPAPVELAEFGEQKVTSWIEGLKATGGTKLMPALSAALTQPEDAERHRMIVVVSDGIINDETAVLELLREKLGEGRLFAVGTGKQIRQQTLLRLAEYGRGAAAFAGDSDSLEAAVDDLFVSISQPIGWDVKLAFEGGEVESIVPERLPDLYAGRPVRVLAWFRDDLPSALRLKMSTMEGERYYNVKLPPRVP